MRHIRPDGGDNARHFEAGPRRCVSRWWVVALALEQVCAVNSGCVHLDENLMRAWNGGRCGTWDYYLRTTKIVQSGNSHKFAPRLPRHN